MSKAIKRRNIPLPPRPPCRLIREWDGKLLNKKEHDDYEKASKEWDLKYGNGVSDETN